ncbi:NAD(P)-dependent dehydrogenase (short-subunit alcohol dehydrogenase family) [Microbacteriaceae bacterium SG_E_30_P1]|uniref:NAD(P)-dependent dehydrogenase (Short-subunit alcohol dehydrogenase family) n=1 Tax=Antiquaquibacter oligotrophicus TaxID=2880260 RepID=A0ABT6KR69_9MICO|nr:SDR family oxidoreductase [Antiquaquibacter oligotrophicus]MDH6182344.1 NAD(P)-dependent dehydrogenase (short-subunit alcohol dehydrogenase family) [Antiquaquibacter oligotrophicus]UDF12003.1 SDR family oxidoreductase [Antiquaquibacter oligotrophicus]
MPDATEFEGLVAIVTGGAQGIGAAIADRLAAGGARVAILDLNPGSADHVWVEADLGNEESVSSAVSTVVETLGRLDIVVNNAAISAAGTIEDNDDETWARVLSVNVTGIARTARAALPHLRQSPSAAIVNLGSIVATAGLPQRALYTAAKGAVLALTRAMAADHIQDGVRVNCVNPGTADTPWVARLVAAAEDPVAERTALEARQPHGRLVAPTEIADAVAYLASPRSGSTNGTALAVDGGMQDLRLRPRSS